ncbi:hypothetical protein ANO14919_098240 [Xylariales sp. No.14919]|nr:hypothetical protein ANO14919_098240 [Xylariales sp. No.14919]
MIDGVYLRKPREWRLEDPRRSAKATSGRRSSRSGSSVHARRSAGRHFEKRPWLKTANDAFDRQFCVDLPSRLNFLIGGAKSASRNGDDSESSPDHAHAKASFLSLAGQSRENQSPGRKLCAMGESNVTPNPPNHDLQTFHGRL